MPMQVIFEANFNLYAAHMYILSWIHKKVSYSWNIQLQIKAINISKLGLQVIISSNKNKTL